MKTQTYITPNGYTYLYIPEYIDLSDESITDVLDEAPKYNNYYLMWVSQHHLDYLEQKFFIGVTNDDGNAPLIFKHREIQVNILQRANGTYTFGIFTTGDKKELSTQLVKELSNGDIDGTFLRGMEKILDYNYGGNMDEDTIHAASTMIFG